jgi:predicted RNase H-like HicB family nuclease
MIQEGTYAISVHYKVKRGHTGKLVAKCNEFPAIIVQGKTLYDVEREIMEGVNGYLNTFPKRHETAIEKGYVVRIENQEQREHFENKIKAQKLKLAEDQQQLERLTEDQIGTEWVENKAEIITVTH